MFIAWFSWNRLLPSLLKHKHIIAFFFAKLTLAFAKWRWRVILHQQLWNFVTTTPLWALDTFWQIYVMLNLYRTEVVWWVVTLLTDF